MIVPRSLPAGDLLQTIRKAGKPLLESVELIDRFEGGQLDSDQCSQAFRLRYRGKDSTLTDELIQPVHDKGSPGTGQAVQGGAAQLILDINTRHSR